MPAGAGLAASLRSRARRVRPSGVSENTCSAVKANGQEGAGASCWKRKVSASGEAATTSQGRWRAWP
jgi:hypothetical protein